METSASTAAAQADTFEVSELLAKEVCELAARHDLPAGDIVQALVGLVATMVAKPNAVFDSPPEYVVDQRAEPAHAEDSQREPVRSTHRFFDVLGARASRRDFGTDPLDLARLYGVLHWTVGERGETIAYDFRDAPLRYVPSAGGLASVDAYVIANRVSGLDAGSYYFDYRRGLVALSKGYMAQKVADLTPGQSWLSRAAALVVFVANTERVAHKYGPMGFKLTLLDAGVAAGHAELVAAALELRATMLGGLPVDPLSRLLKIDGQTRVPIVSLALGTRTGRG